MVQGHGGRDAGLQESVDQIVVVIDPSLILLPDTIRQHTAPGDGESECEYDDTEPRSVSLVHTPVTVDTEAGQELHVLLVLVVGVARHVPAGPVFDDPILPGEHIPDAQSLAVLVPAPLDL